MSGEQIVQPGEYLATSPIPIAAGALFTGYYSGRAKHSLLDRPDANPGPHHRIPGKIVFPPHTLVTRVTSFDYRTGGTRLAHVIATTYEVSGRRAVRGLYLLHPCTGSSASTAEETIVSPPGKESLPTPEFLKGLVWPAGSAIGIESRRSAVVFLPDGRAISLKALGKNDQEDGLGGWDDVDEVRSPVDLIGDDEEEELPLASGVPNQDNPEPEPALLRDVGEVGKAFLTLKGAQATAEATASAREAWPVHGLLYDNGEGPMILGSKHVGSTTMRVDRTGNVKLEKEETLYLPDGTLVQEFTFRRGRASMYVTPLEQVIVIWRQRDPAGEHPPLLAIMDATPCIVGYLTICQHLAGRST